jgi:carbonic anhydrase
MPYVKTVVENFTQQKLRNKLNQSMSFIESLLPVRNLTDTTPFGTGGWDPFHPSLVMTIYHWGYWGSMTEPPCSTFVAWRVMTEPTYTSKVQWAQMKRILFTNQNESCEYTSFSYNHSVARPMQPNHGRLIHKCTRDDYVSDKVKAEMREKTGNPNWCC